MTVEERIKTFSELGNRIVDFQNPIVKGALHKAYQENQWFTVDNSKKAIESIAFELLDQSKLEQWVSHYDLTSIGNKSIGLVLAGNIPLVGFHDLLCTIISGHKAVVKTSSKDDALVKMIVDQLTGINPDISDYITTTDKLEGFDAVIATGSNNTAQHFEYYFKDYPKIIRKNRVSVALLSGHESKEELTQMSDDVFSYFGLGCRNISKIYIPNNFNIDDLFAAFYPYKDIINHHKYNNNYAYNEAIWLMGQDEFLTNGFIVMKEDSSLYSRIASIYYERYNDIENVVSTLIEQQDSIQCISTNMDISDIGAVPLGSCQSPTLSDYADHINTMEFLINL